ncbi:MAG: 50S ribosomal protein L23 [Acidobacteria bacterium]|nr:MAG: 50S ribosomal protein L23 [Acidobacteriota bacterium]
MKNAHDILLRPIVTERSNELQEQNPPAYVFEVARDANKIEIKKAVEKIFKVNVKKVTVMNYDGKRKRLGKHEGKRRSWKKAIIFLTESSQRIDFFENV